MFSKEETLPLGSFESQDCGMAVLEGIDPLTLQSRTPRLGGVKDWPKVTELAVAEPGRKRRPSDLCCWSPASAPTLSKGHCVLTVTTSPWDASFLDDSM